MTDQLALIDTGPKLTPQQALVMDALRKAGPDGLHADEAGALAHSRMESRWSHHPDDRCVYCAQRGMQILKALRAKGLARYRRGMRQQPGYWQAVGAAEAVEHPRGMLRADEPLPF